MDHKVRTAEARADSDRFGDLRRLIAEEMPKRGIPGLAAALVEGSETLWTEGFGTTNLEKTDAVTADTPFSIQSAGKPTRRRRS